MFYSAEILSLRSSNPSISIVWLAGTLGPNSSLLSKTPPASSSTGNAKPANDNISSNNDPPPHFRLTKKDYLRVNLPETCKYIILPPHPMSLRLQSNLMVGVTRVYGRQVGAQYTDVQGVVRGLTHSIAERVEQARGAKRPRANNQQHDAPPEQDRNASLSSVGLSGLVGAPSHLSSRMASSISNMSSFAPPPGHEMQQQQQQPHEELDFTVPGFDDLFEPQPNDDNINNPAAAGNARGRGLSPSLKRRAVLFDDRIVLSRAEMFAALVLAANESADEPDDGHEAGGSRGW